MVELALPRFAILTTVLPTPAQPLEQSSTKTGRASLDSTLQCAAARTPALTLLSPLRLRTPLRSGCRIKSPGVSHYLCETQIPLVSCFLRAGLEAMNPAQGSAGLSGDLTLKELTMVALQH